MQFPDMKKSGPTDQYLHSISFSQLPITEQRFPMTYYWKNMGTHHACPSPTHPSRPNQWWKSFFLTPSVSAKRSLTREIETPAASSQFSYVQHALCPMIRQPEGQRALSNLAQSGPHRLKAELPELIMPLVSQPKTKLSILVYHERWHLLHTAGGRQRREAHPTRQPTSVGFFRICL